MLSPTLKSGEGDASPPDRRPPCVPYTIGCFLEVDEVMVEDTMVLQMFLYKLSYVEDLFLC